MNREMFKKWVRRKKFIRLLAYPIMNLKGVYQQKQYLKTEDSKYIKSLKRIHEGQRCFIIGNGPSLKPEDLDKLTNEITFAANRIYNIFSRTDWRPTYYMAVDKEMLAANVNEIKSKGTYPKFIRYEAQKYGRKKEDNIWYILLDPHYHINKLVSPPKPGSDASHYIGRWDTVTACAIEMAIYMGCMCIYLLGCDHNYTLKLGRDGKVYEDKTIKSSYFDGMETSNKDRRLTNLAVQNVDLMNHAYISCRELAISKGVKIYNATRGGKLEVFERVDFDDLMHQKRIERGMK